MKKPNSCEGDQGSKSFGWKFMDILTPKIVSMIRKYHNHKLQTNPWHREEEPHNNHETPGRQTKQSNQLSLPHQDDCKIRMETFSYTQQNIEQLQNPTMGEKQSTTNQQQPIQSLFWVMVISCFSTKTYVVGTLKNRLNETVLLNTKTHV